MFLGYLVTQRGIEVNPDQISIILNMRSPTCKRGQDVERAPRGFKLIHQSIYGQMQTLLSSLEEEHGRLLLGQRMRDSVPRYDEIFGFTTTLVQAHLGRNVISLFGHLRISRERSSDL